MRIALLSTAILALAALVLGTTGCLSRMGEASYWEGAIEDFEVADAAAFPEPGAILFVGSSSIRLWKNLERDMAPLRVLNRGFGGSHMAHVLHYADRIVLPYVPRAIVVYEGDNDIAADKTAETVAREFRALVERVHRSQPGVPVYFLTIKASRLRWDLWPEMARANRLIEEMAATDPLVRVIDVSGPMIARGDGGKPPGELFIFDGLHLSDEGYALWSGIVRARLLADLGAE